MTQTKPLSKVSSEWFRHLPQKEQRAFVEHLKSSAVLFQRLENIIEEREESVRKLETDLGAYNEGFAFKQAFLNGQKKTLHDLKTLVSLGGNK